MKASLGAGREGGVKLPLRHLQVLLRLAQGGRLLHLPGCNEGIAVCKVKRWPNIDPIY